MGNEFGHPEWIDFPRQGNGYSYHYARRQWSLAGNGFLRYQGLNEFDRAMMALDERRRLLSDPFIEQLSLDEEARVLVVRRGALVFAFNFDAERSYSGLRIPVPDAVDYTVALDTDRPEFGGFGRTEPGAAYLLQAAPAQGRDQSVQVYLPARSAQVLEPAAALK
jgi:1,4-alpha-glucan branching enzyme